MSLQISLGQLVELAVILGIGWGLVRRLIRIEQRVELMWRVFCQRFDVSDPDKDDA
jgi:hypothetical protein